MHLRSKKKQNFDPTTQRLLDQGIVKIKRDKESKGKSSKEKLKEFGRVTYDFWSGVKYILILSALLWWLPLFGPILSGYVGGRRTGGPNKGLVAAILALGLVGAVHYAFTQALIPASIMTLLEMPSSVLASAYQRPLLAPYVRFLQLYWSAFFTEILGGLPFSPNSYILTIIFAYVGGVISEDKKREISEAEGKGEETINIDLSRIAQSLPSGHSNPKSTAQARKARLIKSNFGNWDDYSNSGKKLEDLKAIQYNRGNKSSKKKSKKKKKKKKESSPEEYEEDKRFSPYKQNKVPMGTVRHHSNSEGDDWEIL